jgi:hypothetical protein
MEPVSRIIYSSVCSKVTTNKMANLTTVNEIIIRGFFLTVAYFLRRKYECSFIKVYRNIMLNNLITLGSKK